MGLAAWSSPELGTLSLHVVFRDSEQDATASGTSTTTRSAVTTSNTT